MEKQRTTRRHQERRPAAYIGDCGGCEDIRASAEDDRLSSVIGKGEARPGAVRGSFTGSDGVVGGGTETQEKKG